MTQDQILIALRLRREELGLTQREVAKMLFTSPSTVSDWEGGKHAPSLDSLIRWAHIVALHIVATTSDTINAQAVVETLPRITPPLRRGHRRNSE